MLDYEQLTVTFLYENAEQYLTLSDLLKKLDMLVVDYNPNDSRVVARMPEGMTESLLRRCLDGSGIKITSVKELWAYSLLDDVPSGQSGDGGRRSLR